MLGTHVGPGDDAVRRAWASHGVLRTRVRPGTDVVHGADAVDWWGRRHCAACRGGDLLGGIRGLSRLSVQRPF